MGLITKEVKVKWNKRTREHYENKGYIFTKTSDIFTVLVEDLPTSSNIEIECFCDECGKENHYRWVDYNRCLKDGKYYCSHCAMSLYGRDKIRKTKLCNSTSFEKWCYNNLQKSKAKAILSKWDYELNNCKPSEISYSSQGINRNGYYFKCLDNPNHKSELKNICRLSSKSSKWTKDKIFNCKQCNLVVNTHPEILIYFKNKEDVENLTHGSDRKVLATCPQCGYEKHIRVPDLISNGFGCLKCSDGVSYPEKFMFSFFEHIGVEFIPQYSKTSAQWCKKYRYDFYLPEYNAICEVHGLQHYEGWNRRKDILHEIQQTDKHKKDLALKNGISLYIEIDARQSNIDHMKNSILNSKLNNIVNLDLADWGKYNIDAQSSLVKKACNIWNNGDKSTKSIANSMKTSMSAIRDYLKTGSNIGWCDYVDNHVVSNDKEIVCLNNGEKYRSITAASKKFNTCITNISSCLNGKSNSAGKHPVTGEKLIWRFVDNCEPKCEWENIVDCVNFSRVICLNSNEVFSTVRSVRNKYNISESSISACLNQKQLTAGRHPTTNEKLKWMYYNDYIKLNNNIA